MLSALPNVAKLQYFLFSASRWLSSSDFQCTNCGSAAYTTVDRKYLVTALRRCAGCQLLYRAPTDDASANFRFYQSAYRQGFTTDLPSLAELNSMLCTGFKGTEKSYASYIAVLRQLGLGAGAAIFDYGCSWGYGSWQLNRAGYRVKACEISHPRACFARGKLQVDCTSDISAGLFDGASANSFDCFFSAHVLEHVPSPSKVIALARMALRPGGYFVAFTPNGSAAYRKRNALAWHLLWGQVHPNLIDDEFYRNAFAGNHLYLDTSPATLGEIARFAAGQQASSGELSGDELLCISRF